MIRRRQKNTEVDVTDVDLMTDVDLRIREVFQMANPDGYNTSTCMACDRVKMINRTMLIGVAPVDNK